MSDIRVDTISAANGTDPVTLTKQRAVVFFADYDQATPSIVDSLNASSLTDQGTGISYITFVTSMSSSAYAKYGLAGKSGGAGSESMKFQISAAVFMQPLSFFDPS